MKYTKILASVAVLTSLSLASCKDSFLEVQKPDGDPLEEYYTTEERLQEAVTAAYDPLHWPDWGLGQYNALNIDAEVMGDNFWVGGANRDDMKNWHLLFNYEADANNTFSSLWTVDYSGIKRCNDVLKYIADAADAISPETYNLFEAQARTLRVFYYNMLWHYFGNVPFYLVNLEAPYTAPQLTADEVYNELIVELEAIIDAGHLPFRYYKKADGSDDSGQLGRVTQAMAYMMYAEMVMYQNDNSRFSKALDYMRQVINGGFSLNSDFAAIWETAGEWCNESIWEIIYNDANNERGWSSPLAVGGTVMPTLIGPPYKVPEEDFDADGWGFLPVRKETYDMFADNDARKAATVWVIAEKPDHQPRYQDTHMWLNKYRPKNSNMAAAGFDQNLNYNNNLRYYRLAEALLNASELSLRTGGSGTGEAKEWVNQVRQRAGLEPLASVTVNDILTERHLEFVGEGKRYFDLVRAEGIAEAGSENKASTALVPDSYGYRTNSWTPQKKYIPIAKAELDTDPALVQNNY